MARDLYHELVKQILIEDGWTITDDPYYIRWKPEWQIDLGAEKIIGAKKENQQIAVEVKSFQRASFSNEFHSILGQYLNYFSALKRTDPNRKLYLAVPELIWETKFQIEGVLASLEDYKVKLIIYDIDTNKMDKVEQKIEKYNQILTKYITELADERNNSLGSEKNYQAIIDKKNNHFQLVRTGWHKNNSLYAILIHLSINAETGNIWILQNNTEIDIDIELKEIAAIPKVHFVLAFYPEKARKYSEYAIN